jgi:hypothetical protein
VAPEVKTNVFQVSDEDLLTTDGEVDALSKVKPLSFAPKAGFMSSAIEEMAFTFSKPIVRDPRQTSVRRSFEKESSPETEVAIYQKHTTISHFRVRNMKKARRK